MTAPLVGHVVNRVGRDDRRRRFLGWNGGHGVDWRWQAAVEPDQVDRSDLGVFAPGLECPAPVAATALSHRRQWQACVDEGMPRLVFEDDACLRHGGAVVLDKALKGLTVADLVLFGCNTDADLVVELPDRLFAQVGFGNAAHAQPGYFDAFSSLCPQLPPPPMYRSYLLWGLLAYAVSPAGAARLLRECFPLRQAEVDLFRDGRRRSGAALDFQLNAALQRGAITALLCFPPVVVGPNGDSDLDERKT